MIFRGFFVDCRVLKAVISGIEAVIVDGNGVWRRLCGCSGMLFAERVDPGSA